VRPCSVTIRMSPLTYLAVISSSDHSVAVTSCCGSRSSFSPGISSRGRIRRASPSAPKHMFNDLVRTAHFTHRKCRIVPAAGLPGLYLVDRTFAGTHHTGSRPGGAMREPSRKVYIPPTPRPRNGCRRLKMARAYSAPQRRSVKPSRKLRRFESSTRHTVHVRPQTWEYRVGGRSAWGPVESGRVRVSTTVHGNMAGTRILVVMTWLASRRRRPTLRGSGPAPGPP
jgi:hypothetical protein